MAKSSITKGLSEDTKTIITVLCILLVFPVGIILMWVWNKWPIWLKIIITVIPLIILLFVGSLIGFIFSHIPKDAWHTSISSSSSYISSTDLPDKLDVSRSVTPLGQNPNPATFYKEVNDPTVVGDLYKAILALPIYPTPRYGVHCVMNPSFARYELSFFKNNVIIKKGTMTIVACGGGMTITLDGDYEREFYDQQQFIPLLEKAFGVTADQLHGE